MRSVDTIIVGGGAAGCVLANRLSEDPGRQVLLLEAGGPVTGLFKDMPIAFQAYVQRRDLNWNFIGEPEPALGGRTIEVPRGKALGGSSAINGMVYARGHRLDYDDWARQGLRGWSYAEVLPYFRRSEKSWLGENAYHGSAGELEVVVPTANMMYAELRAASIAAGYPATDDVHGAQTEGVQRSEMTVRAGRRGNAARLFLRPALGRRNLSVQTRALATRVIVENGRAVGVEFGRDGRAEVVRAAQEVILAGGVYGSAHALMLSGIGPADDLRRVGVAPIVDLPGVGRNLIEHPFLLMGWQPRQGVYQQQLRLDRAMVSALRWWLFGTGLFATNGAAGNIFIRTDPSCDRPDMQFTCMSTEVCAQGLSFPGRPPKALLGVGVSMIRQDSRGAVSLRSANPADPPRILFNLFEQRSDVARMVRGIRAARAIYGHKPLADLVESELLPGRDLESDAALGDWVRRVGAITQHAVGTCRMGVDADPAAVVDDQLRVRGVAGLRVIDASVMPNVPGGNTYAPTIMIAEKGADLIRGRALPRASV